MDSPLRYRSLFWPILLIGLGVIFLLANLGVISQVNVNTILSLWPLILIVIGLDLIFGRRSPLVGGLIGLLLVAAVIAALIAGPALGLPGGEALQTRAITEPLGEATSAKISMDFSSQPVKVHPTLQNSANLLEADIQYYGSLQYSSSGNPVRQIRLTHSSMGFNFAFDLTGNPRWDIGLNPKVPIDLHLNSSSGSVELDLADLKLSGFFLDQGSGSASVDLPTALQPYTAEFHGGSGSLNLSLHSGGNLTLRLDRGSGSTNIHVPSSTAVRLEIRDSGSGSVNLSLDMTKISGGEREKEGVWQTPGYDQAASKIDILCDNLGSGSFNLD